MRLQGVAQQAADVVATTVVIALAVQANPVKALLAVTTQTVLVLQRSAQRKLAVVVHLAVVAVVSVVATARGIKAMVAEVMISNPATFDTMPVAT